MSEFVTAVFVTALFVASGRFATTRWRMSRDPIVRRDYAIHAFMAITMILMSWVPLPAAIRVGSIVIFVGAAGWFVLCAIQGNGAVTTRRFRILATYHAFMMVAMAVMFVSMGPHGSLAMSSMGMAGDHDATSGGAMIVVGSLLGIAAVFWAVRAVQGLRHDSARLRRRLGEHRLYEFAMALGMAVMSLAHVGL